MFTTQITCELGDVKIGWEDANDPEIRAIIEKKLQEKYHFFRQSDSDPTQQIRIRKIDEVGRHVIIPDSDLHDLFTRGKIGIVVEDVSDTAQTAGPERVTSAAAVMSGRTVAHRPLRGG